MQIKEQWKGSRNWKLVMGVATAATLGLGAMAVATPAADVAPQSINLRDRAVVTDDRSTGGSFVPTAEFSPDVSLQGDLSLDSVDDSLDLSVDSVDDSLDLSVDSVDDSLDLSVDSVDDSDDLSVDSVDDSLDFSVDSVDDSDDSLDGPDDSD